MISDFMDKTGRLGDEEKNGFTKNCLLYTDYNLNEGIEFSKWLIEQGFKKEPFFKFSLVKFIKWAKLKLKDKVKETSL